MILIPSNSERPVIHLVDSTNQSISVRLGSKRTWEVDRPSSKKISTICSRGSFGSYIGLEPMEPARVNTSRMRRSNTRNNVAYYFLSSISSNPSSSNIFPYFPAPTRSSLIKHPGTCTYPSSHQPHPAPSLQSPQPTPTQRNMQPTDHSIHPLPNSSSPCIPAPQRRIRI
jgi:hypothetical protein